MPGLGDLLHLVSGQTLLGSVRERHAQNLGSAGHHTAHIPSSTNAQTLGSAGHPAAHMTPSTDALAQLGQHDAGGHRAAGNSADAEGISSASDGARSRVSLRSGLDRRPTQEAGPCKQAACSNNDQSVHAIGSLRNAHVNSDSRSTTKSGGRQAADILDLYLTSDTGDQLIATAVRPHTATAASQDPAGSSIDLASRSMSNTKADFGAADTAAGMITMYRADSGGSQMLCRVDQNGFIKPAMQLRPGVQHQMISSATPFVRSLHFVVHTGTVIWSQQTLLHSSSHSCRHLSIAFKGCCSGKL